MALGNIIDEKGEALQSFYAVEFRGGATREKWEAMRDDSVSQQREGGVSIKI